MSDPVGMEQIEASPGTSFVPATESEPATFRVETVVKVEHAHFEPRSRWADIAFPASLMVIQLLLGIGMIEVAVRLGDLADALGRVAVTSAP